MILRAPGLTRQVLDVPVEEGTAPAPWDAPIAEPPHLWADQGQLLFRALGSAVHVTADRVVLDTPDAGQRASMDWLLYATATRALLSLRHRFNLHGGLVVAPDGRAWALLGESTAGKSTTAVELVRRGWTLASDDIAEVVPGPDGALALPVARPLHLSDPAARALGADVEQGRWLPERDKRAYDAPADLAPRPLAGLVVLTEREGAGEVVAREVPGLEALPVLAWSADRYGICRLPAHRAAFHDWTTWLARTVPLWHVERPAGRDTVGEVADVVTGLA
ncbi:hypothetical protein [Nocardioides sp. LML1-1-1.1]|uniref:hypothetical protein n=1 Tax=Nocardioides sp. LML1-1-1.1 TaxID=3135248 RepID=UPI00343114F0